MTGGEIREAASDAYLARAGRVSDNGIAAAVDVVRSALAEELVDALNRGLSHHEDCSALWAEDYCRCNKAKAIRIVRMVCE